ncbi:MAG: hypothetical protein EOP87_15055 [Verrucomicrobiaceae bacterium]|nr:MAG: hypothetical protein EOP87_15055 [Verrucomicrobiaceae bacterium]
MKFPVPLLLIPLCVLPLSGCKQFLYGSNDVNFLGVPKNPRPSRNTYAGSGGGYGGGSTYTPTPAQSYSQVESQAQKDANYRRQLDRQIHNNTTSGIRGGSY